MISYLYIHVYSRSHFIIYAVCIIIIYPIHVCCQVYHYSIFSTNGHFWTTSSLSLAKLDKHLV